MSAGKGHRALRDLKKFAARHGFVYEGMTRKRHYRWRGPDGQLLVTGSSLNDPRALNNVESAMKRATRNDNDQHRTA